MMAIEWTSKVWNPITGCDKVSGGCKNCYAEGIAKRFWGDRKFNDVRCHEDRLSMPDKWKKPAKIFVNSMSDLFHKDVPFEFVVKIYEKIRSNPRHTFQILTKRPDRLMEFYSWLDKGWEHHKRLARLDNLWIGVSVEDQKTAEERIPLLQISHATTWISAEPLLGPINFRKRVKCSTPGPTNPIKWVVVGCESGPRRRECKLEWIESIVAQCQAAGVAVFVKQISINGKVVKDIEKFPEHLRIRQFPIIHER